MLYRPTSAELSSVIESFRSLHPNLSTRIDRAVDILIDMELNARQEFWQVPSQSNALGSYRVNAMSGTCTCPDFGKMHICKHLIAVDSYEKNLESNLQLHLIPATGAGIRQARFDPAHWLLRVANTSAVTNVSKDAIRFHTAWSNRHDSMSFASPLDAATFSTWLRVAKPEVVERDRYNAINDPHCLSLPLFDEALAFFA